MTTKNLTCCAPEEAEALTGKAVDDLAVMAKALGHSVRVRIVELLAAKGECISGDLAEQFELAQSTVSEHLRILKEAGLVQGIVDGQRRCYCINRKTLTYLKGLVRAL